MPRLRCLHRPAPLALLLALAACGNDDPDEVTVLEETVSVQDSVIAAQQAELAELRATLDTARTVAADSALAHADDPALVADGAGDGPGIGLEADPGTGASGGWPAPDALAYDTYRNDRFGFSVDYPYDLLQPDEAVGDGHGQSFSSPDGSATLLVYGSGDGEAAALREEYEAELARPDVRVSYRVIRPRWFVVSGYEGPYIFYQRTHQTADGLRTFRLRHRAADKDYFDAVVERLSRSFAG